MKTQFTPGPWHRTPMQDTIWDCTQDIQIARISDLPSDERGKSNWMQEQANARLIAAAPELLEALQGIIDYAENEAMALGDLKDSDIAEAQASAVVVACCKARAAIAQATGGGM